MNAFKRWWNSWGWLVIGVLIAGGIVYFAKPTTVHVAVEVQHPDK